MTKHTSFSRKVREALRFYVYAYYDPRTEKPFYIGKGQGNRVFDHLHDGADKEKVQVIRELADLGLLPNMRILWHGVSAKEALLVEAVAIDLLGIDNLTNEVRGHYSRKFGSMSIDEIIRIYDADPVDIDVPAILIRINRAYQPGMTPRELYEMTRSSWKVSLVRCKKAQYAMAIFQGVIVEVYEIAGWFPGGATYGDDVHGERGPKTFERYEFVGRPAMEVRDRYIGKSVAHVWKPGAQNPIQYMNV